MKNSTALFVHRGRSDTYSNCARSVVVFPSDDAAMKLLYLALRNLDVHWKPAIEWRAAEREPGGDESETKITPLRRTLSADSPPPGEGEERAPKRRGDQPDSV